MTKDYWLVNLGNASIHRYRGQLEYPWLVVPREALGETWQEKISTYDCAVCESEEGAHRTQQALLRVMQERAQEQWQQANAALESAANRLEWVGALPDRGIR